MANAVCQPELALLLMMCSLIVYFVLGASKSDSNQQNNGMHAIPQVGLRNEWFPKWASYGYSTFNKHGVSYRISTIDRGNVVIVPTDEMKALSKLLEDRLDVFDTLQEQIQAKYTVGDQRVIQDPYHRYLIPSQLTRDLNGHMDQMFAELDSGFMSAWGASPEWEHVVLWEACSNVVARVANSVLCGPPLCSDEKYISLLQTHSTALFSGSTLVSITPKLFRPVIGYIVRLWCKHYTRKLRRMTEPLIEERIEDTKQSQGRTKGAQKPARDALQLIIDEALSRNDSTQLSKDLIAERLLMTNIVSLQGTTFTLFNLILHLATSDPSLKYIETLRDECEKAFGASDAIWTFEVVRSLRLLDSAVRESMRLRPFASVAIARTVMDPSGISIAHGDHDVRVPKGTVLALPMESIHRDEDAYKNAAQFNPFRFVKTKDRDEDGSTTRKYDTIKPATTPDEHFLGFGTSRHPCPGRFLAVHEVKFIAGYLLMNYDIQYTDAKYQPTDLLGFKVPDIGARIRVRRRLG
ncbi:cytochrome P450 [Xylariaceae sp. FL1272]|nr:cytochrome P450 [Xylariaceae sp. FL1272]